jgi:hypothetical protein
MQLQLVVTWSLVLVVLTVLFGLSITIYGLVVFGKGPRFDYDFITPVIGCLLVLTGLAILFGMAIGWVVWGFYG